MKKIVGLLLLPFICMVLTSSLAAGATRCAVSLEHTLLKAADDMPITCQLLGTCSVHASMGSLSSVVRGKGGKAIALSVDHYLLNSYIDGYLRHFFIGDDTEFGEVLSSQFKRDKTASVKGPDSDRIIFLRGSRPMESWQPQIAFERFVIDEGPKDLLNDEEFVRLSEKYFAAVQKVKSFIPVNIGVSYMAHLLIYADFSRIYFSNPELRLHENELNAAFQAGENLRRHMNIQLRSKIGAPDQEFDYQGREFDELSFSRHIVELGSVHTRKFELSNTRGAISIQDATDFIDPIEVTKEVFEKLILEALSKDSFPELGIEWIEEAEFVPTVLDWPEISGIPKRNPLRLHAVQITGAIFDRKGSITHFKVKNSWGAHRGVHGRFLLTAFYFYTFPQ